MTEEDELRLWPKYNDEDIDEYIERHQNIPISDKIEIDHLNTDTLRVKDGQLDRVIKFMKTHNMPSASMHVPRLLVDTEDGTVEITAEDDTIVIQEK